MLSNKKDLPKLLNKPSNRENIVSAVHAALTIEPTDISKAFIERRNDIDNLLENAGYVVIDAGDTANKHIDVACCIRHTNNVYSIQMKDDVLIDEQTKAGMFLHELGHIKYGHFTFNKYNYDTFARLYKENYAEYFKEKKDPIFYRGGIKETFPVKSGTYYMLANLAKDYEVNSRMFTRDEFIEARNLLTKSLIHHRVFQVLIEVEKQRNFADRLPANQAANLSANLYKKFRYMPMDKLTNALKTSLETIGPKGRRFINNDNMYIRSLLELLDPIIEGRGYTAGMHPSDRGFPEGLDWMQYMELLLQQQDVASCIDEAYRSLLIMSGINDQKDVIIGVNIHKMMEARRESANAPKKDDEDIAFPVLEAQEDKSPEEGGVFTQDAFPELNSSKKDDEDITFPMLEVQEDKSPEGRGMFTQDAFLEVNSSEEGPSKDILKLLKDNFLNTRSRLESDQLYYQNRRGSTGVIIPRRTHIERKIKTKLLVLIDVSGSIPVKAIQKILETLKYIIKNEGSQFDLRKSRAVFWTTKLVKDISLERTHEISIGGGTDISKGIDYIADKYLNSGDRLVIISDLYDVLEDWKRSIQNAHLSKKNAVVIELVDLLDVPPNVSVLGTVASIYKVNLVR
jgi:hypothetical protein